MRSICCLTGCRKNEARKTRNCGLPGFCGADAKMRPYTKINGQKEKISSGKQAAKPAME